jgi:hypothetical protein
VVVIFVGDAVLSNSHDQKFERQAQSTQCHSLPLEQLWDGCGMAHETESTWFLLMKTHFVAVRARVIVWQIAKMNFSQRIFDQKRPVFLQYTQCSDYRETMRTWLGGGGFVGAVGVLEGGAMVMAWFHVAHCVESYAFHPGTSWAKMHSGPTCTKMKRVEIV